MNYLAHLYLSGEDEGLLVGNFIADAVRGREKEQYPAFIRRGILMHRFIDTFTDEHPEVNECKILLRPRHSKYAPVVCDILFDYFLATSWNSVSEVPLAAFAQHTYSTLERYREYFPDKSLQFYQYMLKYDILTNYAELKGMQKVFEGMSRRAEFVSNMDAAVDTLHMHTPALRKSFEIFFPELKIAAVNFLTTLPDDRI